MRGATAMPGPPSWGIRMVPGCQPRFAQPGGMSCLDMQQGRGAPRGSSMASSGVAASRGVKMSPRLRLTAAALACTVAIPAAAQTSERLVLSEVIAEVRRDNPDIKAARDRVTAAKTRPAQVSAYDDPMVSYEAWNAPE